MMLVSTSTVPACRATAIRRTETRPWSMASPITFRNGSENRAGGTSFAAGRPLFRSAASGNAHAAAVVKAPSATSPPPQRRRGHLQLVRRRVQSPDQLFSGEVRPIATSQQANGRHERRPGEVVGELLRAVPAGFPRSFGVRRRHGIPRQDVEQLMGEIEVTAARDLTPRDQDCVHLRKATCRPGDVAIRIDHENQDAEFSLHGFPQSHRRHVAQLKLGREPLTSTHRILKP